MERQTTSTRQKQVLFIIITIIGGLFTATALAVAQGGWQAGDEWRGQYKVGDRVELKINDRMWQKCKVVGNSPNSVMRLDCEEYVEPPPGTYRRAAGINTNSSKNDIRPLGKEAAGKGKSLGGFLKRRVSNITNATKGKTEPQKEWAASDEWRSEFAVGDKVQFSISGKVADFQTCTVTENDPQFVMRVKCDAFKQWKADTYIVHSESNISSKKIAAKKETEPTDKDNRSQKPTTPSNQTAPSGGGLKIGEYACAGSGGRILIGLGFKVLSGNRYTDLDNKDRGSFSIVGDTVRFRGGHLDGQVGRDLRNYGFTIGAQAHCEPF
ncbi:MAG: hypothetical protein ABR577_03720 [Pyrinomonadaceae bacterium]